MKKNVYKGILGLVGATSMICFLGSDKGFAESTVEYEDSATSEVDIIVKEDPNVQDKVFKFESVPSGLSFRGQYTDAISKITMTGETEGSNKNIVLKTDIENAENEDYKVTGRMAEVSRVGDGKKFTVDAFSIKFGTRDVDVKSGTGTILDKTTTKNVDKTSSSFYNYIEGYDIESSTLTLAASDQIQKGDVFKGTLTYTLAGTINFD